MIPNTEKEAVTTIIDAIQKAGVTPLYVDDDWDVTQFSNTAEAVEDLMAVDAAWLHVRLANGDRGWLFFVFGNDPEEALSDYTINLEPYIGPVYTSWGL